MLSKYSFAIASVLLLVCPAIGVAQPRDVYAELAADLSLSDGEYCQYDFDTPALSPIPKGYKPFYISHLGRHGARYALPDDVYEWLREVLSAAQEQDQLTPRGVELCTRYEAFYPRVAYRGGELTQKGLDQHRRLAERMYRNFKPVFKGPTHAEAIATNFPRVLMSMFAFLDRLGECDRDFDARVDAGRVHYPTLLPHSSANPAHRKGRAGTGAGEAETYFAETVDPASFASRFFKDTDWLEKEFGMWTFENNLRTVIVDISSLDFDPEDKFEDIFTVEERIGIWKYRNANGYRYMGRSPSGANGSCMAAGGTMKAILEDAEKDLADGKTRLRLRFAHDSAILPLLAWMRLGTWGIESADRQEVDNNFRSYDITMACNLQLIFYRSRRNSEILVKALYNERESTLPLEPVAAEGLYYNWSDFKDYYARLIAESDAWFEGD